MKFTDNARRSVDDPAIAGDRVVDAPATLLHLADCEVGRRLAGSSLAMACNAATASSTLPSAACTYARP